MLYISFKAKVKHPFTTYIIAAFTLPSGNKQQDADFYNGKNQWLLHFSKSKKGKRTCVIPSETKAIDNKKEWVKTKL